VVIDMHTAARILFPVLAILLLPGCWDRREINDVAFVLGSAVDKKGDKYVASIQVALPSQLGGAGSSGGGGGTAGNKSYLLLSSSGETVRMANYEEQLYMSRQLFFAHRRVMLVGEELARDGIAPVMDVLGRIPQNRLSSFMVATRGPALDYMKVTGEIERYPSEIVRELAVNAMKNPATMKLVIDKLLTDGIDIALPAVRIVKNEQGAKSAKSTGIKMDGLAIFRQGKLIRILKGEETQLMLLAMGEAKNAELALHAPRGHGDIVLSLHNTAIQIETSIEEDIPVFRLVVQGKAIVVDNESNFTLASDDQLKELERAMNKHLTAGITQVVRSVQQEGADPIGLGRALSKKMPRAWERYHEKWEVSLKEARIDVQSMVRIGNTGTVLKGFGLKEEELAQ
jgi:spore germination protein KC